MAEYRPLVRDAPSMSPSGLQRHLPRGFAALVDRALREARKFLVIFAYLWILLGLFALHKSILLPNEGVFHGQIFAIVNALVLAKVMLVAEILHLGEHLRSRPLIYPVLLKSALFAVVLICFHLIEEVLAGLVRGRRLSESVADIGGGTLEGIFAVGFIIFVVLIPFFAFREVAGVVGGREMRDLFLVRRMHLGPVAPQGSDAPLPT
jgi:hypothetical protein